MRQFKDFVESELKELETRDADQLFECIRDNLLEMKVDMNDTADDELYAEIELQLNGGLEERLPEELNQALAHYKVTELEMWLSDIPSHALPDLDTTSLKMYSEEMQRILAHFAKVLAKARKALK